MATKYSPNKHTIAEVNRDNAEGIAEAAWTALSQTHKDSWLANSHYNTPSKIKDTTGKLEFMHYFMHAFGTTNNSNSTTFATITLSAGTSGAYTDRATRTWTAS